MSKEDEINCCSSFFISQQTHKSLMGCLPEWNFHCCHHYTLNYLHPFFIPQNTQMVSQALLWEAFLSLPTSNAIREWAEPSKSLREMERNFPGAVGERNSSVCYIERHEPKVNQFGIRAKEWKLLFNSFWKLKKIFYFQSLPRNLNILKKSRNCEA